MSATTPPWPSLYNPGLEILHIEGRPPTQQEGAYLHDATDIFRFTLYWTLVFYTPFFFFCGFYAFCNYAFPPFRPTGLFPPLHSNHPSEHAHELSHGSTTHGDHSDVYMPLQTLNPPYSPYTPQTPAVLWRPIPQAPKKNERRSRAAFGLLVLLLFLSLGVAGAVIGSAVLGFAVMGLYRAAKFNMSTWIPFLLAVIQVFVGLLSIWPSIIEII